MQSQHELNQEDTISAWIKLYTALAKTLQVQVNPNWTRMKTLTEQVLEELSEGNTQNLEALNNDLQKYGRSFASRASLEQEVVDQVLNSIALIKQKGPQSLQVKDEVIAKINSIRDASDRREDIFF